MKKPFKKINNCILLFLIILLMTSTGCIKKEIRMIVPEGMPYIAMGGLEGKMKIKIDRVSGSAALKAAFVANDYDIIVAPFNLGVQLYNAKQSKYTVDSIIGLNNLYIISQPNFNLLTLRDITQTEKPLLAFGQGNTPDLALQAALKSQNVQKEIEYMNTVNEVMPFFASKKYDFALSAEPILTIMRFNQNLLFNSLNLQDYVEAPIIQVAVFANANENKQDRITEVLVQIKQNLNEMYENPNSYAQKLVKKNDYFANIGEKVLTECVKNSNIRYRKATNYRIEINQYLNMIGYEIPHDFIYRK